MLNGKLMAVTLVALAALGGVTNGGAQSFDSDVSFGSLGQVEITPRSLGAFAGLVEAPVPKTEVETSLDINGSLPQDIELKNAVIRPENFTELQAGDRTVSSGTDIKIGQFDGTLEVSESPNIEGKAFSTYSNGVNISGNHKVDQALNSDQIEVLNVEKTQLEMEKVSGTIESSSTSATVSENTELMIDSFSGNISLDIENSRMNLSGKVHTLEAGTVSLGS